MNRKLRITFFNGDVRVGEMPPGQTLIQLWCSFKRDGAIMGELWCAHFDHIAMIEVVEMPDGAAEPKTAPSPFGQPAIDRLAAIAGNGTFKPPGEA